ncbi:neural cell adhesion molecule [Mytilus galloprovincialis]|uniref:Neural cell adhesion molecule n=1 Tax=Mytilus galloprovincialis TaxID=29158 RepID=A0A8B6C6Q8_MYTGA|nr:neural cell adhesion molecule [Mytilus galloprovincialis]
MICLLLISACVLVRTESLSLNTSYARLGRRANIKCPFYPVKTWVGGIRERNLVSITNYKVANPDYPSAKRLAVSEKYSLIIYNVTSFDFQVYRCTRNILDTYDIQLKQANPSNIKIIEETEPHRVVGVVGQNMSTTCTVTSGVPEETLIIKDGDETEMVKGGPGSVKFQLVPDHYDEGRNFTCFALSGDEHVLSYTVQLQLRCKTVSFIVDKPNITIQAYPNNTTLEGNPIEIRCNDEEGSTNVISRYRWLHNGKYLNHSLKVLQINVTSRMDNGNFTCTAENEAGKARDTIEINVLYAPVIEKYSVSFSENNQNISVNCNVSGNPNNFTFGEWNHKSDVDTFIRHLNGSEEGRLNISSFTGTAKAYENGGVYVCKVSNGIPSSNGSLWRTGTIEVIIKESPVFTEQSKPEQIGYIDNTSSLYVDVMSSSKIMSTTWFREGSEIGKIDRATMTRKSQIIETQFHKKMVFTKGYRCTLTINKTKPKDFHNYTVTVQNESGYSSFIIQLQYAGPPRTPKIISVKRTSNGILVKWESVFDGGYTTTYELEYRKVTGTKWDRIQIEENILSTNFIAAPNTDYLVRIKALNKMGHSSFTKQQKVSAEGVVNDNNIPEIHIVPPADNNINLNVLQGAIDVNELQGALDVNVLQGALDVNVLQGAFGESCEGYSSIDRRKRMSRGQKVSYMANRSTKVFSTEL